MSAEKTQLESEGDEVASQYIPAPNQALLEEKKQNGKKDAKKKIKFKDAVSPLREEEKLHKSNGQHTFHTFHTQTKDKMTLLHFASVHGHEDVVKELISAQASIEAKCKVYCVLRGKG